MKTFASQGSFTYYFESITIWSLELDVLYSGFGDWNVVNFDIIPFAGLNIWRWGLKALEDQVQT